MSNNDYGMRVKYKPVVDPKVFNDAIKKLEGQVKHLPIHLKINNYSEIRQKLGTLRGEFKALQKIAENINIPQANVNNLITQQNKNNSGSKGSNSNKLNDNQFIINEAKIKSLTTKVEKLKNELNDAQTAYIKFATDESNQPGGKIFNEHLANIEQYQQELVALDKKSPDFTKQHQAIQQRISIEESWIKSLKNEHALHERNNKEFDKYDSVLRNATDDMNKYAVELKKVGLYSKYEDLQKQIVSRQISTGEAVRELAKLREQMHLLGIDVDTTWGKLKRLFKDKWQPILATQSWYFIFNSLGQIYQNVVQIDAAMTELRKVTDATSKEYIQFLDDAETRARRLGATLVETVNASADMARLGYDLQEASALADTAIVYSNVGDDVESIDEASKSIISTMQGFNIEAENSMEIIDKFNEVANNYASSAGDIGEIVKRSAAAMNVANSTLDETIALGVTANEVLQDSDVVGTALKTMSMRLRSSKSDLEQAGEDTEGMADSASKLREEILALSGVDIMLDEDTFKTPYQMLIEIGKVWDNLTDINRANIGELLFGKRQASVGFAILENYQRAEEILKTSQESAGSALAENEIYLNSIQGRLDKLSATWQSLSNSLLNSDTVKDLISGADTLLGIIKTIVDNLGLIPGLVAGIATAWAKANNAGKECALLPGAA